MRYFFFTLMLLLLLGQAEAQTSPFNIQLEPVTIPNVGGLQSFAFATHGGKWLIIGGRLDGLHRRQPFAAFDAAGNNQQIMVIDPEAKQRWVAPLNTLSTSIREQLSATNMEFVQSGDYLYLVGGYGYSPSLDEHVTYPYLCAVDVPALMADILAGNPIAAHFRQIQDDRFEVTGGRLSKIYDTYYLVGGQKFEGLYNPMGPTHGPGFTQVYTEQIRKFKIMDDGVNLSVTHFPALTDSDALHRRDYNVVAQIMTNGQEGLTAFSGVFQKTVDLPFLNCVNIDSSGYQLNPDFSQYYNHYHCAFVPLYSASNNEMHSVFFGGIAQFYDSLGLLVQDNNVPFVKTIARVTRDASGQMAEFKLPVELPALMGAGAEFIPVEQIPSYSNGVIKLDDLTDQPQLIGYIYGGIASTVQNAFWINTGSETSASNQIFKVFLDKNTSSATHALNPASTGSLQLQVFPNPNNGVFSLKFQLPEKAPIWLSIADLNGKIIDREQLPNLVPGEHIIQKKLGSLTVGSTYVVTLETASEKAVVKTVVQD